MTKVRILKTMNGYGVVRKYPAGTVVEVEDLTAKRLVEDGYAVYADARRRETASVEVPERTVAPPPERKRIA